MAKMIKVESCEHCSYWLKWMGPHCIQLDREIDNSRETIHPDCPLPDYKDVTELESKLTKSEERYRLTRRTHRKMQVTLAEVEKERDKLREVVDKITKYADDGYSMERHFGDNLSILNVKSLLRGE